jgi:methylmalonyl-CoA/ethylmalonyl-CoA epimerase
MFIILKSEGVIMSDDLNKEESLAEFLKDLPGSHIGLVVKDIDKTVEVLSKVLGIGPWMNVPTKFNKEQMVEGKAHTNKVVLAKMDKLGLGQLTLTLLQPVTEGTIFNKFLKTKGEGIHHLGITVKNYNEVVSRIESFGYKKIMGVNSPDGKGGWCHFNIDGLDLEILTEEVPDYNALGATLR